MRLQFPWLAALGLALVPVFAEAAPPPVAPAPATVTPTPSATAVPAVGTGNTSPQAVPAAATPVTTKTCTEHIPEGKARPAFSEQFPARGQSGHATWLTVTLTHGLGEQLLPGAFELQSDSESAKAVRAAGFVLPDAKGTARVRIVRTEKNGLVESRVSIPLVPLPKQAGRNELTLPPLPIAMTRSSGEIITLCTQPHAITVEDPIANQPEAKPKTNQKPTRQLELWETLRNVVYGSAAGLVLAGLLLWLISWWRKRPKIVPPAPPPRPAWEVALEALHDIRQSHLIEQGRLDVHLERVSHVLRRYLGGRYGFEALESTSEEILRELKQREVSGGDFVDVRQFLTETDLVKFADVTPTESQCSWAIDQAELLVNRTRPTTTLPQDNAPQSNAGKLEPTVSSPPAVPSPPSPSRTEASPPVQRGLEDPSTRKSDNGEPQ